MSVLSTAAATAYGNRAQWHPAFSGPRRRKAQKSSGFQASGTYGHCIKDNVLIEPAMGSAAFLNEAVSQLAEAYLERKQKETGLSIPHDERQRELQKIKMFIADRNVYVTPSIGLWK